MKGWSWKISFMSKTSAVPRESHQYILVLRRWLSAATKIFRDKLVHFQGKYPIFINIVLCMVLWTEARVWFYGQKHVSHTNIFERGEYICPQSYAVRKHDKLIGENTKVGNKIISYNYYKSVCVPHTCKTVKVNILHISVSFVWHFSFVVGFNLDESWKKFQQTCLRAGWNWLTQLFMRWKNF